MQTAAILSIISVLAVSLISFAGLLTLTLSSNLAKKSLSHLVSFSAGALLGDVFIHLLPKMAEEGELTFQTSIWILATIVIFFVMEKYVHWHHHPMEGEETHAHHLVLANLLGDGIHNIIDGMIIAGSFLVDQRLGLATTLAVILHEIPQEFGDFGVLIYAGLSKARALFYNFLSALTALLGAVLVLLTGTNVTGIFISIAVGSFLYIAIADLIPETHKQKEKFLPHLITFALGISVMYLLLFLE